MKINKYSKVARHKINAQNSIALLYNNNEISEKEMKNIPFCSCNKKSGIPKNKYNKGYKAPIH